MGDGHPCAGTDDAGVDAALRRSARCRARTSEHHRASGPQLSTAELIICSSLPLSPCVCQTVRVCVSAQTNKAFVSPGVFHELSGGQLDCYVEYSNYIFLVGCASH